MPSYPDAAPAIQTDIRLYSTDVQAFTENGQKDLVVRTTFEPGSSTCTVAVFVGDQPGGGMGREVARRIIFTGTPAPSPVMTPEEAVTRFGKGEE
jgi:hypothetical protein